MMISEPLVGVAHCAKCDAVGTIVEMHLCCRVAELASLGGLWDVLPRKRNTAAGRAHAVKSTEEQKEHGRDRDTA